MRQEMALKALCASWRIACQFIRYEGPLGSRRLHPRRCVLHQMGVFTPERHVKHPTSQIHYLCGQQMSETCRDCRYFATMMPSLSKSRGRIIDFSSDEIQEKVRFLTEKLGCLEEEAKQLIIKYPRISSMAQTKVASVVELFDDRSISKEEIMTYPEIFSYSLKTLQERFRQMEGCSEGDLKLVDVKDAEKFFAKRLKKNFMDWNLMKSYGSKVDLVMTKLGCSRSEAEMFVESIQVISLSSLEKKIDCILNDVALPTSFLLATPWLLNHSPDAVLRRLQKIRNAGLTHENCEAYSHLLTVESRFFDTRLAYHVKEREVLGDCRDLSEYLCKRLECTQTDVEKMSKNFLKLLSVNAPKIEQHLDFLLQELRFPPGDIVRYPRVLSFACETIKTRYRTLVDGGVPPERIGVKELQLPKKQFQKFIRNFK